MITVAVRIIAFSALLVLLSVNYYTFSAAASAAPATSSTKPKSYLVRHESVSDSNGQFMLAYALNDGTTQMKKGTLVQNNDGTGFVLNQEGSYSFVTPDGIKVKISYTADKNGFIVKGYPL